MRDFISPEIKSYTSEEILELIGPAETQYAGAQYSYTFSEDLADPPTTWCMDIWEFSANAGTNITATAVPSALLDIGMDLEPGFLATVNANGAGGTETFSYTLPSTGVWRIEAWDLAVSGAGSYTLTVTSDGPLSVWTLTADNSPCF